MAAIGDEFADFGGDAVGEVWGAGAEGDHHGFGVFAEEAEEPELEAMLHGREA